MSFVGPRPEVKKYVDMFTEEEQEILGVRPGITDWASLWNSDEGAILEGCDDPDAAYETLIRPTKLKLQLKYAREHNCWTDLRIMVFTVMKLVRKKWFPRELKQYENLVPRSKKSSHVDQ